MNRKAEKTLTKLVSLKRQRAEQAGVKLDDLKRSGRMDDLRRELEEKKVFDLLGEKANITEEKV